MPAQLESYHINVAPIRGSIPPESQMIFEGSIPEDQCAITCHSYWIGTDKVEDIIGEEALEAAGEAGIKIRDGSVHAWDTVSTGTLEFEEKVRETTSNTKAGKLGTKLVNRFKNRHQKNEQENKPEDSIEGSEIISLAAAPTSIDVSKSVQEASNKQYR